MRFSGMCGNAPWRRQPRWEHANRRAAGGRARSYYTWARGADEHGRARGDGRHAALSARRSTKNARDRRRFRPRRVQADSRQNATRALYPGVEASERQARRSGSAEKAAVAALPLLTDFERHGSDLSRPAKTNVRGRLKAKRPQFPAWSSQKPAPFPPNQPSIRHLNDSSKIPSHHSCGCCQQCDRPDATARVACGSPHHAFAPRGHTRAARDASRLPSRRAARDLAHGRLRAPKVGD